MIVKFHNNKTIIKMNVSEWEVSGVAMCQNNYHGFDTSTIAMIMSKFTFL